MAWLDLDDFSFLATRTTADKYAAADINSVDDNLTQMRDNLNLIIGGNTQPTKTLATLITDVAAHTALRLMEKQITISNATGDATNDVTLSTGWMYDSTGVYEMALTSALTKKTDADFAAGDNAGGGNLSSSAWYHVFLIRKDSDGTIDAYFDTDGAAANKPAGYTYYRHVGWIYHSTSTGVMAFFQVGNRFYLTTKVRSIATQNPGTNAVLAALTCPPDMIAIFTFIFQNSSSTDSYALVTSPTQTDSTPSSSLYDLYAVGGDGVRESARFETLTDSSSRIRYRVSYSATTVWVFATSDGWIDTLL